jgi:peptidoglycan L-alanyl-D-glutamate endopeptidase CwlK
LSKKKVNNLGLQPKVQRLCDLFIQECAKSGFEIVITEGFRSFERQKELYDQGRTKSGYIVTNAKPGQSLHNYGVAFDCVFKINGKTTYAVPESSWQAIGKIGQSVGLEWGGAWKSFVDRPHFQLMLGYTLNDFINKKIDWNKYL